MSSILKDIMVAKFVELNDSTDSVNRTGGWFDVEDGRIKSFELIASSVYEYIISTEIVSTTVGNVTTPGPVIVPTTDTSLETIISLGTEADLKSTIVSPEGLTSLEVIQNVFTALDNWLVGWTVSFGDGLVITGGVGDGILTFTPIFPSAKTCLDEIALEAHTSYEDSLGIIAKYIHLGLSVNVTVLFPYSTTGLVAGNPYTGLTTTIWTFK